MKEANAKTLGAVHTHTHTHTHTHNIYKRIENRNNQKTEKIGFINYAIKLYIKYKELKINKRRPEIRCQTSDIRYHTSDAASVK